MKLKTILVVLIITSASEAVFDCSRTNRAGDSGEKDKPFLPGTLVREERIPLKAKKILPSDDEYYPVVHSEEWEQPVNLGSPINTAGVEDAPVITPDGNTLYFWFTPDITVPPKKQILDGVTGIYVSVREGGVWGVPRRVFLQDVGQQSLDGPLCLIENQMYFCSARKGNFRGVDIWIAEYKDGRWQNWRNAGVKINKTYKVGELYITADGQQMYFASDRPGGNGKLDIWVSTKVAGEWQNPVNVQQVNSPEDENQPFVTEDGRELWFSKASGYLRGTPGIFRSVRTGTGWSKPQEIVSHFAGDPGLDREGNLYFVHHFFKKGKLLEADLYVAKKKEVLPRVPLRSP